MKQIQYVNHFPNKSGLFKFLDLYSILPYFVKVASVAFSALVLSHHFVNFIMSCM